MGWTFNPPLRGLGSMGVRDHYCGPLVSVHEWTDERRFVVTGDLRGAIVARYCSNNDADDRIRAIVSDVPDLRDAIEFDSETCQFFANTKTLGAAQALVGIIMALYLDIRDKA